MGQCEPAIEYRCHAERYGAVCQFPMKQFEHVMDLKEILFINDDIFDCVEVDEFEATKTSQGARLHFISKCTSVLNRSDADIKTHIACIERKSKRDGQKASRDAMTKQALLLRQLKRGPKTHKRESGTVRNLLRRRC